MKNYKPVMSFDEETAVTYRDVKRGDEDAAVAFLAELTGPGPALELAIGAGRIALPLAARGVRVDGIDSRRRWWRSCAPSRAATRSTSRSATSPTCRCRGPTA